MSILAIVVAVIGWPLSLWFFSRRQGTVAIAITGFLAVFFLVDAFHLRGAGRPTAFDGARLSGGRLDVELPVSSPNSDRILL